MYQKIIVKEYFSKNPDDEVSIVTIGFKKEDEGCWITIPKTEVKELINQLQTICA